MTDTTQLRALRDAANESWTAAWVDRAIAALEQQQACMGCIASNCVCHCNLPCIKHVARPAEQAQPSFPLPDVRNELPRCSCGYVGWPEPSCRSCGKQFNEQAQPPAYTPALTPYSQPVPLVHGPEHGCAQPPVLTDVPPMPQPGEMWGHERILALHAACVRIAAERDEWRERAENTADELFNLRNRCGLGPEQAGPSVFERLEQAERERDETRAELEAERAGRPGSINAMTITSLRERLAEAEAKLAALEGQEPVATLRYSAGWQVQWSASCQPFPGISLPVYARPVPADSSPREQHEAALAEAKREGLREALELVERDAKRMHQWPSLMDALTTAADGIRALMEGGK